MGSAWEKSASGEKIDKTANNAIRKTPGNPVGQSAGGDGRGIVAGIGAVRKG